MVKITLGLFFLSLSSFFVVSLFLFLFVSLCIVLGSLFVFLTKTCISIVACAVFHVTDANGRKVIDQETISLIEKVSDI